MLVVDANVLLYAVNRRTPEHDPARDWFSRALSGQEAVAFAWTVESPPAVAIDPTRRHLPLLAGLLVQAGTAGNLVGDAHLAALALEHDATLVSFDRDVARFDGLRIVRPG